MFSYVIIVRTAPAPLIPPQPGADGLSFLLLLIAFFAALMLLRVWSRMKEVERQFDLLEEFMRSRFITVLSEAQIERLLEQTIQERLRTAGAFASGANEVLKEHISALIRKVVACMMRSLEREKPGSKVSCFSAYLTVVMALLPDALCAWMGLTPEAAEGLTYFVQQEAASAMGGRVVYFRCRRPADSPETSRG